MKVSPALGGKGSGELKKKFLPKYCFTAFDKPLLGPEVNRICPLSKNASGWAESETILFTVLAPWTVKLLAYAAFASPQPASNSVLLQPG